jgi:hypothetical protein
MRIAVLGAGNVGKALGEAASWREGSRRSRCRRQPLELATCNALGRRPIPSSPSSLPPPLKRRLLARV